ncbi:hypothetical protein [Chryseobacterium luteum]|uniref:Uncharacterized protein n=1 Tax=Chryseobacterium luteum TaxID=421531 RepID=A0A085ZXI3_9FLAO|nr:hypothetical protein [Chryseobacterium luteum]KFF09147.1 hypothetical protein IX38_01115 [Chryseobacterium luteum]
MNKEKLIEKAKKILETLKIEYDQNEEPLFSDSYPQSLIDIEPELVNQISVYFRSVPLAGRAFGESITVIGDLKTKKLISVVTKGGGRYNVPTDLQ